MPGSKKKYKIQDIGVPIVSYQSEEQVLPSYHVYTTVRRNVLSVNDDSLRVMPYFNDEEPDEIDNLTYLFRDEIKSFPKRNLQREKTNRLLPIVYRMLEKFERSPDSIFRFLRKGTSALYNIESEGQAGDESVHHSFTI